MAFVFSRYHEKTLDMQRENQDYKTMENQTAKIKSRVMKKRPIPLNVSGVSYITRAGTIRYCTTGPGIPLPDDFCEFERKLNKTG